MTFPFRLRSLNNSRCEDLLKHEQCKPKQDGVLLVISSRGCVGVSIENLHIGFLDL